MSRRYGYLDFTQTGCEIPIILPTNFPEDSTYIYKVQLIGGGGGGGHGNGKNIGWIIYSVVGGSGSSGALYDSSLDNNVNNKILPILYNREFKVGVGKGGNKGVHLSNGATTDIKKYTSILLYNNII